MAAGAAYRSCGEPACQLSGIAVVYQGEDRVSDKDAINRKDHGVSLAFGEQVLADPERLDVLDVRFDYGEERFVSYGKVEGRVWVCVFTKRGEAYRNQCQESQCARNPTIRENAAAVGTWTQP